MATALTYAIKFVEDMEKAVGFHVDMLGLKLRFHSPEWSEFETGTTTLALHIASVVGSRWVILSIYSVQT